MERASEPEDQHRFVAEASLVVERLAAVARAATAAHEDPATAVQALVHQTAVAFDAAGGVLALVDDAGTPVPRVVLGEALVTSPTGELPLEWVLPLAAAAISGERLYLEDRLAGAARFPEWDTFEATAAAVALPLYVRGSCLGAIGLFFARPRTFEHVARRYLELVADLCALCLAGESATPHALAPPHDPSRWLLDEAAAEIAVLDRDGVIVEVNDAWLEFGRRNDADPVRCGVGVSYLAVCDAAAGDLAAAMIGGAIRAALAGTPMAGSIAIPCATPGGERWYDVMVSTRWDPVRPTAVVGATVVITRTFPVRDEA